MTNLTRWDPFREMASWDPFRMSERFFDDRFWRPWLGTTREEFMFPVEISEREDHLEVKAALPGVNAEDIDVTVEGGVLRIRAEMKEEKEDQQPQKSYHRREMQYGRYERTVTLPYDVKADAAEARFENGILQLRLPKAESARAKQIPVSAGSSRVIEGRTSGQASSTPSGQSSPQSGS